MENKTEEVKVEETKNEETGAVAQTETQKEEKAEVEMISKEKAQEMVDKALAKKLPPKEELEAYKKWKESQKTEAEKQTEKEKEYESTKNELSSLKQENLALKKGVKGDDLDYVVFKISKLEGDFEDNLDKFLKDNPKYLGVKEQESKTDGVQTQKVANNNEDGVMAILKAKHPDKF